MNTTRILKIGLAWINIAYVVCYLLLGLIPGLRFSILPYALHLSLAAPLGNIFTIGNFIVGILLWNVVVAGGILLAGALSNYIRE